MKTAVQLLIDVINTYPELATKEWILGQCEEVKHEERQIIKDAFNQGYREGFSDAQHVVENEKDVSEYEDADNYYKNTFTQPVSDK